MVDVLLGLQWGDEGKGKIVDVLAENYDVVARFQGGPNAGHTLKIHGNKYVLHTIPSGIFREGLINLIGNGVVIDPITLCREIDTLTESNIDFLDRLFVSKKAHLILPTHRYLDAVNEAAKGKAKIGSTLKGIGPTYMDKTGRNGLRVGDIVMPNFEERYRALKEKHRNLSAIYPAIDFDWEKEESAWFKSVDRLRELTLVDGEYSMKEWMDKGFRILAEGAQGTMLDIEYGTYPFVTSSNTISSGVCSGLGIAPQHIGEVIGITKAYCTRVGSGPFPTEQSNEVGQKLQELGGEFGATTGRPRRCGWIDLAQLKYALMINGVTQLVVTKLDVLSGFNSLKAGIGYTVNGEHTQRFPFSYDENVTKPIYQEHEGWSDSLDDITEYDELPPSALKYLTDLEAALNVPITMVSTGPEREKLLWKANNSVEV